jgi:adenosylcobinamide-GDP ribazoletransferase
MIGLLAALVDIAAAAVWMPAASAMLTVLALVLFTGALHLDGLADTADGMYGGRQPEKALAIMKDSRIGAMGAVVMICCLAVKWVGLWGISNDRFLCILLVPAYARSAALLGIRLLPYGRPEGTGRDFFNAPLKWVDFWGLIPVVALSLLMGPRMVFINFGCILIVTIILGYYRKKMGCITGDMLGGMIEFVEAALFLILSAGSAGG